MKKHLLIGASLLTLGITTTAIYAQVTGTSVVDKMKAVAHSFTLAATLNPSDSGLTSEPVKGKKTGDILTAGEYNRLLELVSEGGSGGGSFQISFKKDYSKDGNSSVPTTENIGSHDFCALTRYGEGVTSDGTAGYCKVEKGTNGIWTVSIQALNNNINCQVTCFTGSGGGSSGNGSQISSRAAAVRAAGYTLPIPSTIKDWPDTIVCEGYGGMAGGTEILNLSLTTSGAVVYWEQDGIGLWFNASTGVVTDAQRVNATCGASAGNIATICAAGRCIYASSASAGSSWVDIPLTDTAAYDPDNCQYRFKLTGPVGPAGYDFSSNGYYNAYYVTPGLMESVSGIFIKSSNKNVVYAIDNTNNNVTNFTTALNWRPTKIEKKCN